MADKINLLPCEVSAIILDSLNKFVIRDEATLNALQIAAASLRSGQLVAFPTETVYGLGSIITDSNAVQNIFKTKGRPADNPLIVHVSSQEMLKDLLTMKIYDHLPPFYSVLMQKFWPGALSLLVPLPPTTIAPEVHASLPTLVVRMPSHPVAQALIHYTGVPLAAPSANSSGRPSPTIAQHVKEDMIAKHGRTEQWSGLTILDGGDCGVGVESTVIDGLGADDEGKPCIRILRLGGIGPDEIRRVLKSEGFLDTRVLIYKKDWQDESLNLHPTTPGMKYRHYAPDAEIVFIEPQLSAMTGEQLKNGTQERLTLEQLLQISSFPGTKIGFLLPEPSAFLASLQQYQSSRNLVVHSLGSDSAEHAHNVFAKLRSMEASGVKTIYVETPTDGAWSHGIGLAVEERLGKAAVKEGTGKSPRVISIALTS